LRVKGDTSCPNISTFTGKSTLMRIMSGMDKDFTGEAWAAEGAKVGYLPQEPHLDDSKSVRDNVMDGVADKRAILERYNELAMNYSDETAEEMAALQDQIDAANLWDLDAQVDVSMEALRWSRSANSCSKPPICFCSMSQPTTLTPKPSLGSSST